MEYLDIPRAGNDTKRLIEIQNDIQIDLKMFEGRKLTIKQQHLKDSLIGAYNAIGRLNEIIHEREDQLAINYRECISLGVKLKKEAMKVIDYEKRMVEQGRRINELEKINEELKSNINL